MVGTSKDCRRQICPETKKMVPMNTDQIQKFLSKGLSITEIQQQGNVIEIRIMLIYTYVERKYMYILIFRERLEGLGFQGYLVEHECHVQYVDGEKNGVDVYAKNGWVYHDI